MKAASYSHDGNKSARTALSGWCVGVVSGGVGGGPAAATCEAREESDITIVADDSAASYGASATTLRR